MLLSGQVIPGQTRKEIDLIGGDILWEEDTPLTQGQVYRVLYTGQQIRTGSVPFLALYIDEILLAPIFFVSEAEFVKVMSQLQENPNMTQRIDDEDTITFISSDGQYGYKLSSALMKGRELVGEGLAERELLMRYLDPSCAYAVIHVDYSIMKALGYGSQL